MASNTPSEVRVFADGGVYRAVVGADEPTGISDTIDEAVWTYLGYLSTAGPRFSFGRETKDIEVWQSFNPVRTVSTKIPISLKADFMQTNVATLMTALGGGDVVETSPGEFEYSPPDPAEIDEMALMVVLLDGDLSYRYIFRRATLSDATDFAGVKDDATNLPVTWKFLQPDGGESPFIIQTDDPAFEPTALFS